MYICFYMYMYVVHVYTLLPVALQLKFYRTGVADCEVGQQ